LAAYSDAFLLILESPFVSVLRLSVAEFVHHWIVTFRESVPENREAVPCHWCCQEIRHPSIARPFRIDWVERLKEHRMVLSPCHSRRDIRPEKGLYFCRHPKVHLPGGVVDATFCGGCRLAEQPPPECPRPFSPPPAAFHDGPCFYLGDQVSEQECPSCRGSVRIKVYRCHHPAHSETKLADCSFCTDYSSRLAPGVVKTWQIGALSPQVVPRRDSDAATSPEPIQGNGLSSQFLVFAAMIIDHPLADAYALTNDAARFETLRSRLERDLWPARQLSLVLADSALDEAAQLVRLESSECRRAIQSADSFVLAPASARAVLAMWAGLNHEHMARIRCVPALRDVLARWVESARGGCFAYVRDDAVERFDESIPVGRGS
jgi:hypothetical protein